MRCTVALVTVHQALCQVADASRQPCHCNCAAALRAPTAMLLSDTRPASSLALAPSLLFALLRVIARAMVATAVLCLISGGVEVLSCTIVITQGALWLQVCEAPAHCLTTATLTRGKRALCCGARCGGAGLRGVPATLRGLGIAGIVFTVIEFCTIFSPMLAFGVDYSYGGGSATGNTAAVLAATAIRVAAAA